MVSESALLKQSVDGEYPVVSHGDGVFLYDVAGRDYLDGSSGAMTASIGHGVEEVAEAMYAQAKRVAFSYRTQFTNQPAETLATRLASVAPTDLNKAFFVNSGSEATEYAIRAVVSHWKQKSRPEKVKVLGRHVSYHGMTMGALSMSGHDARRPDYGSLLHPFPVAPPAHAYRYARPTESEHDYAIRCIAEFERAILAEDPATVAAVIAEPIVGAAGGVLVPPAGYLSMLRELCNRLNVLLILDEVITGIGRTGEWFACTASNVVPDVLVFGKGLSGGYAPVAGVLLHDHMVDVLRAGSGIAPFGHTFSGNPLGAATCLAVLDLIERENVLDNVRRRGAQLRDGLRRLANVHPAMADIRGDGLLWGFEFVVDQETRRAPDARHDASGVFARECMDKGLIVYPAGFAPFNNAAMICPPLTITADEVEELLVRLGVALDSMDDHVDTWLAEERESVGTASTAGSVA